MSATSWPQDISELKAELLYKDILLERHHEKLAHWQGVMSRIQSVQRSLPVSSGVPPGQHPAAAMPPPPAGAPGGPAFPQQGALAHLEESASNIGMSDRWRAARSERVCVSSWSERVCVSLWGEGLRRIVWVSVVVFYPTVIVLNVQLKKCKKYWQFCRVFRIDGQRSGCVAWKGLSLVVCRLLFF